MAMTSRSAKKLTMYFFRHVRSFSTLVASHSAFDSLLPKNRIEEGFSRSGYTIGHNPTI
jgi:hypothetical protein